MRGRKKGSASGGDKKDGDEVDEDLKTMMSLGEGMFIVAVAIDVAVEKEDWRRRSCGARGGRWQDLMSTTKAGSRDGKAATALDLIWIWSGVVRDKV